VDELRFATSDLEVVVLPEVGGRLHRLRAFGIDVLRTPDDPTEHLVEPFFWGGYPMLPWCGRVASGLMRVDGELVDLPPNQAEGWAIHGQAYEAPWQVVGDSTLRFLGGGQGWPWSYEAGMSFSVEDAALTVDMSLQNTSDEPMPAGIGLHPWFAGPPLLRIPADLAYDDNTLSSPLPMPVSGAYDVRQLGELEVGLDSTWTGLTDRRVELAWPEHGLRGELSAVSSDNLVFVAAHLANVDAIALEPQTHAPQGLRRLINGEPDPMALLQPGATLTLSVNLRFDRG
jgi:aldose 1-epimerase